MLTVYILIFPDKMNILPKKNWHVRTKKNIERVRRDEAKAADEAKELDRRMRLAEQEARTSMLREKAKQKMIQSGADLFPVEAESSDQPVAEREEVGITGTGGHVNFFQQLENGEGGDVRTNKEHEEEKKKEQEDYEKKVGYLTYLGQDTEELTGEQVWWKKLPKNRKENTEENLNSAVVGQKQKDFLDPLSDLKKQLQCDGSRLTYQKYERKQEETEPSSDPPQVLQSMEKKQKKRKRSRSSSSSSSSSRGRSRRRSKDRKKKSKKHSSRSDRSSKKKKSHLKKKRRRKISESSSSTDSEAESKMKARANLEKLRRERLERERVEREKADRLLYGEPVKEKSREEELQSRAPKYSSQFNPDLARQNKLDPKKKYWLE